MIHLPSLTGWTGEPIARWLDDPRAIAILDNLRVNPPVYTYLAHIDRWDGNEGVWTGPQVDALDAIYGEYWTRIQPTNDTTDWTAYDEFMAQPRVQDAIYDAMNPAEPEPPFWDTLLADTLLSLRPQVPVSDAWRA